MWRLRSLLVLGLCSCKASSMGHEQAPGTPPAPLDVAITVDDLPVHGASYAGIDRLAIADRLLAAFASHRVGPVYGFVNGQRVDEEPPTEAILQHWLAGGHKLGNHTWSHPSLNTTPIPEYLADIERGEAILSKLGALHTWRAFRYPYLYEGDTAEKRDRVRAFLSERGYTIAKVSIDGSDWAYNAPFARCRDRNDEATLAELTRTFVAGHVAELHRVRALTQDLIGRDIKHVLLLHIGAADAAAIDDLLAAYEREGVRWIELEDALADPFYALEPDQPQPFGSAAPYRIARERHVAARLPEHVPHLEQHLEALCREPLHGPSGPE